MNAPRHIHIVGAGLAGLATALHLALRGERVSLYESAPWAGGRCRSYHDRELDCLLDNGNHLVLSGNVAVRDYLALCGATDTMVTADRALFPFRDCTTGARWTLDLGSGAIPWSLLWARNRVPETHLTEYLHALRPLMASRFATVANTLPINTPLGKKLWEPLTIAMLNTECQVASAHLLGAVFRQTLLAGGRACRPMLPREGLSETFVTPCLAMLEKHGVIVRNNARLKGLRISDTTVTGLDFGEVRYDLAPQDWVVLAMPPWSVHDVLPAMQVPTEFRSIVNLHYRVNVPTPPVPFLGLIGGLAEWLFFKPHVLSVTISAADRYEDQPQDKWAARVWHDVALACGLDSEWVPPWRFVREKRATFAATPKQNAQRPRAWVGWKNLALAGDWTDTGLPSTIEGSLRSGMKAAQTVLRWRN